MCASQRTDPTQRTVTQHLHTFSHLQARSSGCSERSQGCFCSRSEARSGLIRFFGFNLVACPSRVFPSRLFFSFSCAVLLDLVCARRSYIHRLLLLLLLAGRPLLVTWCAAMVSLPPAGFSAVAVWPVGWFPWSSSGQSANQREDFNTTQDFVYSTSNLYLRLRTFEHSILKNKTKTNHCDFVSIEHASCSLNLENLRDW